MCAYTLCEIRVKIIRGLCSSPLFGDSFYSNRMKYPIEITFEWTWNAESNGPLMKLKEGKTECQRTIVDGCQIFNCIRNLAHSNCNMPSERWRNIYIFNVSGTRSCTSWFICTVNLYRVDLFRERVVRPDLNYTSSSSEAILSRLATMESRFEEGKRALNRTDSLTSEPKNLQHQTRVFSFFSPVSSLGVCVVSHFWL